MGAGRGRRNTVEAMLRLAPPGLQSAIWSVRMEWARLRRKHWYFEVADRQEFFRRAFVTLAFNGIEGDYAEFGCWSGNTFWLAFKESRKAGVNCKLWAFDSFQGLPASAIPEDQHPAWPAGAMRMSVEEFHAAARRHGIPATAYEVVPGYYETSLAPQAQNQSLPSRIALAYIDCDLYSSTKQVLGFLLPRLQHGMILAFDDYFCWSRDAVSGERRACGEAFDSNPEWRLVPYVQYGWAGLSFVVESKRLAAGRDATPSR